jgi:hypothetical protein
MKADVTSDTAHFKEDHHESVREMLPSLNEPLFGLVGKMCVCCFQRPRFSHKVHDSNNLGDLARLGG